MTESNQEFDRSERINAVLREMIGGRDPVRRVDEWPVRGAVPRIEKAPFPDFSDIDEVPTRDDLKARIAALEPIYKALKPLVKVFSDMERGVACDLTLEEMRALGASRDPAPRLGLTPEALIPLCGAFDASRIGVRSLWQATWRRMFQLEAQLELLYGKGRRRPRNDGRAFLVAFKVADFYLEQLGEYPTVGSGVGGIPTGRYCIAVDRIFSILIIEQSFRSPAEASVKILKEAKQRIKSKMKMKIALTFSDWENE